MSRFPGTEEMLKRVSDLGELLREVAERGDVLEREIRARTGTEQAGFQKDAEAMDERHVADLLAAETSHEAEIAGATARFEQRSTVIHQAFIGSRRRYAQDTEATEGNRKHRIQLQKMVMDEAYPKEYI